MGVDLLGKYFKINISKSCFTSIFNSFRIYPKSSEIRTITSQKYHINKVDNQIFSPSK